MKRWIGAVVMGAALSGPGRAEMAQEQLPEGYPPKMGVVTATVGGTAAEWWTYDFSVGAFDASAWMQRGEGNGYEVRIMAYLPDQPHQMEGRIFLEAVFDRLPEAGEVAEAATIRIPERDDLDGPRLTSEGGAARIEMTGFSREGHEAYGRMTGNFAATLCRARGEPPRITKRCTPIEGRFETEVQFDNM